MWWLKQTRGRTLFVPFGRGSKTRYIQFGFCRRIILAHRAAFALMHGRWVAEIDHINGNGRDNRACNLREVTRSQNTLNRKKPISNNSTGHTGIGFHKASNKWIVRAAKDGRKLYRLAVSKEEAIQIRNQLIKDLYGESFHASLQS
jgi:hypothetical protein